MEKKTKTEERPNRAIIVKFPPSGDLPTPKVASYFQFSFLGDQITMNVGYVDSAAVTRDSGDGDVVIPAKITDRFAMSIQTLQMLREQLAEAVQKLAQGGVKLPAVSERES